MKRTALAVAGIALLAAAFVGTARAQARRWVPIAELPARPTAMEIMNDSTVLIGTATPSLILVRGSKIDWEIRLDTSRLPYFDYPHGVIQDILVISESEVLLAFQYGHARRVNLVGLTTSELQLRPINTFARSGNGTILAGSRYQSTDGGQTWDTTESFQRPPDEFTAVQGSSGGTFYAVTPFDGPWRSTDAGDSWQELTDITRTPDSLTGAGAPLFVFDDRTIIVSAGNYRSMEGQSVGLYRTVNEGRQWDKVVALEGFHSATMYAQSGAIALAGLHPESGDFHIYMTTDAGDTWTTVDDGLPTSAIPGVMAVRGGTAFAYVSNADSEVLYRLESSSEVASIQQPYSKHSISPNPVRGDATIHLTSPVSVTVRFDVLNVLGEHVLYDRWRDVAAGESRHVLNASTLQPGCYWLVVRDLSSREWSPVAFVVE